MTRFLQWFTQWGRGVEFRKKVRDLGGIKKYPTYQTPYKIVPSAYDAWIDALQCDRLNGSVFINGKEDLSFIDNYDILFTIILGDNIGSTAWLREHYPEKKIITILEPFPPYWYSYNVNALMSDRFPHMLKDVQAADMVLLDSVVYIEQLNKIYQTDKITYNPNPNENEYIKGFWKPEERRDDLLGGGQHCNFVHTRTETEKVLDIFGRRGEIERWLFNNLPTVSYPKWDRTIPRMPNGDDYLREQNKLHVFVDNCTGACSIQTRRCAAMGIPTIGNCEIDSQLQICPDLAPSPSNYKAMAILLEELFDNESFYKEQVKKTLINVELYSYNSCKERLFKELKRFDLV